MTNSGPPHFISSLWIGQNLGQYAWPTSSGCFSIGLRFLFGERERERPSYGVLRGPVPNWWRFCASGWHQKTMDRIRPSKLNQNRRRRRSMQKQQNGLPIGTHRPMACVRFHHQVLDRAPTVVPCSHTRKTARNAPRCRWVNDPVGEVRGFSKHQQLAGIIVAGCFRSY